MLTALTISAFKRFVHARLRLAPLTVLTGINGSGKTSVLHALLLMQASRGGTCALNGPFDLALGTMADIRNQQAEQEISFALEMQENEAQPAQVTFHLSSERDDDLVAKVALSGEKPEWMGYASRHFQYLCAERLGPRTTAECVSIDPAQLAVGHRGQYCAQLFYHRGREKIDVKRRCPNTPEEDIFTLRYQTEQWLSRIVRPVSIDCERAAFAEVVAFKFRPPNGDWVRPTNMGFGVSYALPVIMAGLLAPVGGVLMVENPEAHLHPAGQSEIGKFLALIAASGVQVIVETHSDHVLNGMRLAIGADQILPSSQAVIHYFDDSTQHELSFTPRGSVSAWPKGFFDQYQLDVASLTRVRRAP